MDIIHLGRHNFTQPLEQLYFLERLALDYVNGHLQIFNSANSLSIYFEYGKIVYACQYDNMWDLLCCKLQELTPQIPVLSADIYTNLKVIFERGIDNKLLASHDYLAIWWLVNQKYLNPFQAGMLIEELVFDVMQSFLLLKDGIYEFSYKTFLDEMPKFCHIDVSSLAIRYQESVHQIEVLTSHQQKSTEYKQVVHRTIEVEKTLPLEDKYTSYTYVEEVKSPKQKNIQSKPKQRYKILCIDDSSTVITAIKGFLDERLFDVIGINDSLQALMQILESKPDLILLDISMPNLDGYELCALLRKHRDFRNTPVVMVTGRTGFLDKARAKIVQSSGYLTKPFTKASLLKVVFQHVGSM